MRPKQNASNDRRLALALSIVCLAVVFLAGCGSSSATTSKETPTPKLTTTPHAVAAVPTGFTTYRGATFSLSYPIGWVKQNPANGTGVQYQGPKQQVFVTANLGKLQNTPADFNKAFCSPTGFGGAPSGAAQTVKISGESWVQQQCVDAKGGKSAVVGSTVYKTQFYYMVYSSPTADFQANKTQYFTTMEQSFTFV